MTYIEQLDEIARANNTKLINIYQDITVSNFYAYLYYNRQKGYVLFPLAKWFDENGIKPQEFSEWSFIKDKKIIEDNMLSLGMKKVA